MKSLESCQPCLTWAQIDVVVMMKALKNRHLLQLPAPSHTAAKPPVIMLSFVYYCHRSFEDLYCTFNNSNFKKKGVLRQY